MAQETRLFINNIPDDVDETNLREAFSQYGKVCNVDLKTKIESDNYPKKFAFITLSASSYQVESCIKYFSNEDFNGSKLYVTRARESFLERLQREREQAQRKEEIKNEDIKELPKSNPVIKLSEKLNPRKRNFENKNEFNKKKDSFRVKTPMLEKQNKSMNEFGNIVEEKQTSFTADFDQKKHIADHKRLESMKKKRNEFKEKQKIIKTGLVGIDKVHNKKIIFNDEDEQIGQTNTKSIKLPKEEKAVNKQNALFEDDESDNDVNFEIKEQFEGKKGQKVLELQSRYKSDKRFVLDERFIDDDDEGPGEKMKNEDEEKYDEIVTAQEDEKIKQLNILQDVLGVQIRSYSTTESMKDVKKNKSKLGMLRFDPTHPEHAKFLVPVEEKQEVTKKSKKKKIKDKQDVNNVEQPEPEVKKVVVSKEQFYKVSDTLKEAIAKPATFSLRSLFVNNEEDEKKEEQEQDTGYIPIEALKETKVRNPLDPGEKNPFMYDSSDSDDEDKKEAKDVSPQIPQPKAVWKENLFFSKFDDRLRDGLMFFANSSPNGHKERRGLRSLMKKRINNAERKNQMFQKKIGGRKKSMKKRYRTK